MSWFSDLTADLTSKLQEVTDQVAEQAKSALPLDNEMLAKLTLTTPELDEERKRIDQEEKRKERIHDCLAGMFPWETRDPERDILVEECKESILKLSHDEATFQGPYLMPDMAVKLTQSVEKEEKEGDEDGDDEDDDEEAKKKEDDKPSEESLDKLATLEPLPKLLQDFDLDAHVGLIQRLLTVDPNLVKMQSKLSGGGKRELYFWKNYFFHCAYTRYVCGLSVDEIWSDEDPEERQAKQVAEAEQAAAQKVEAPAKTEEETITFDNNEASQTQTQTLDESAKSAFASPEPETEVVSAAEATDSADVPAAPASVSSNAADTNVTDFEKIGSEAGIEDDVGFGDDDFDVELDELEAEIARELED